MIGLGLILLASLFGLACVSYSLGEPWISRLERGLSQIARNRWIGLAIVGLVTLIPRLLVLPWMGIPQPQIHDEFGYLLSADTFLHGRLSNPAHAMWVFFESIHIIHSPTYAAIYPPAQGAVLAVGALLGHPWIGVLVSTTAMAMAMAWMLQGWMSAEWAFLGGILIGTRIGLFTYWMNSYWGGSVAAVGAALALGAFPRLMKALRTRYALIFAIGASIMATSRPFEGFIFLSPLALIGLWKLLRQDDPERKKLATRAVAVVAGVLVCTFAFIGYDNYRVTGDATKFPHQVELESYYTAPVFLWDASRPKFILRNPELDYYYNQLFYDLDSNIRKDLAGAWIDRIFQMWGFFVGPALTIPLFAILWLGRAQWTRLLWLQFGLSFAGLMALEWWWPHYTAPLLANLFLLLMLGMKRVRSMKILEKPIGIGLTRMVAISVILEGPVYFLGVKLGESTSSQWTKFLTWFGYAGREVMLLPISLLILLFLVLLSSYLRNDGSRRILISIFEVSLLVLFLAEANRIGRGLYPYNYPVARGTGSVGNQFRKPYEDQLNAIPGKHLVLVRYGPSHRIEDEFVYNGADIDGQKVVWARDISTRNLSPLLAYFHDRKVWILEPEADFPNLCFYSSKPSS